MASLGSKAASVVLLSGGLDSAANLALCAQQDLPILALTADYGQRASQRELAAAAALSDHFGVRHEIVDLSWLGRLGGGSLTDPAREIPRLRGDELDRLEVTRASGACVWVPNRNGVLIGVAAAFAERLGASRVVVGFNAEEALTFPDNSVEFLRRMNAALNLSTREELEVFSYTAEWDKKRIVRELLERVPEFPFSMLWSCYLGGERACGECESCRRLERALTREPRTEHSPVWPA